MPSLCNSKKKFVFDLLTRQYDMLKDKTEHIEDLDDLCNKKEQRSLVKNLLVDFS